MPGERADGVALVMHEDGDDIAVPSTFSFWPNRRKNGHELGSNQSAPSTFALFAPRDKIESGAHG